MGIADRTIGTGLRLRRRQRGSAMVEYSIITLLLILVLVSQDNQIARLMEAIKSMYEAFSYAISATFPMI